jgi:hypothetical protein
MKVEAKGRPKGKPWVRKMGPEGVLWCGAKDD